MIFRNPLHVFTASHPAEVLPVMSAAEQRADAAGLFAAGFVTYEAAPGFDSAYRTRPAGQLPLVWLGLFEQPESHTDLEAGQGPNPTPCWETEESAADYSAKIRAIKRQIELGNTYQINYTLRQCAAVTAPWQLFLGIAPDVGYAAYIECEDHAIVCASPELFFELSGEQVRCKPMKGTARRGMVLADDLDMRKTLQNSAKNRAENVMITDMIRNDLGRIARVGSVEPSMLFDVEKLRTVWQMTSTVTASTKASITEIFQALFPCASVTGAPKVASMALIADLEDSPRGAYTGAIGFFGPGRQARFNVAIRTATIDKRTSEAVYGMGGGIVWDSEPAEEYDECLSKAGILAVPHADASPFQLLETMLWTPRDGLFLLDEHLDRLCSSATYFDFEFDLAKVRGVLLRRVGRLSTAPHRIRLLLHRDGRVRTSHKVYLPNANRLTRLNLASDPIDQNDPFIYHKTTRREVYERALQTTGADDALLWNRDGYITETTIANVIVNIGGQLFTPPVECGLLAGTYREYLLKMGKIKERRISLHEIASGAEITLINSVRGAYAASLEGAASSPMKVCQR